MNNEYVVSGKKTATLKVVFRRILIGNILGWIVYVLGAFADSIIGGSILGEEALAAIEIVTPLASMIYFISYLVSTGAALLHAKYIGKNDFKGADRIFSTGCIFSVIIGIISGIILILIKDSWLDLYELEGNIREHASEYYDPFIVIALITPLGTHLYNCIVCDGDAVYSVISDFVNAVSNVVLSLILVNKLQTKGLSIATLISTFVGFVIPTVRLFTKSNTLHFKFTFSFKDLFKSMKVGSSSYITVLAIAVIDIIMNFYISKKYNASYTAPYAIVNFGLEIASALALVGQTMITIMNFSIGEGNNKDVYDVLKLSKKVAFYVGLGFTAIFIAGTPLWPELFGLETEEFIKLSNVATLAVGLSFIPQTFLFLISSFNNAYEKTRVSVICGLTNSFLCPLVFPFLLSSLFGYSGFVIGFGVSNIMAYVFIVLYFLLKYKKVFIIPDNFSKTYSIDLILDNDSISKAIIDIRDILKENGIENNLSNKIQLTVEESLAITLKRNKRKTYGRIIIDISDIRVKVIVKDTGEIFDITNADQKINDLSNYVFVMATKNANKAINYVATNLNGNHYEFTI